MGFIVTNLAVSSRAVARFYISAAGRAAYSTARSSSASYSSGLAKAASPRKPTSLPCAGCRSMISGNSSSSQSSVLWTLPRQFYRQAVAFPR